MVGRDNVTFVFSIENRKFMVKGKQMGAMLSEIQRSGTGASNSLNTVGNAGKNAGDKMAASAVNFQTATTGLLNLSTAVVQTYTSISNLARANNRAEMSVIAVARAEDLLNNKKQRLIEMQEAGTTSGMKYANMQREIATATADLTVKEDKMKIEQEAVNDVYMLFATNIANVTISSLQTIGVLLGHERTARLGVAAATKLQSVILSRNVAVTVSSKAATGGHLIVTKAMTFATIKQTAATQGLTAATKMFMRAAWPLLAISTAITAAYLLYENNVLGLKDGIDSLMGTEKSHLDIMNEERSEIDALTQSYDGLHDSIKKLSPVHEQYVKMMRDAAANRGDTRLAAQYQAQLQQPSRQGFSSPSVGGGLPTGVGATISPVTQGATIQQQAQINDTNRRRESRGMDPVGYSAPILTEAPDPFGSIMQQELFKLLTPPEQMETLMQLSISEGLVGRKGAADAYARKAESMRYEAESWRPRGIETDPVKAFKAVQSKNATFEVERNTSYRPTGVSESLKFGGDIGDGSGLAFFLQGRDKGFDSTVGREIFFGGTGGKDIAKWIQKGGDFGRESPIIDLLEARQRFELQDAGLLTKRQTTGFKMNPLIENRRRNQQNINQLVELGIISSAAGNAFNLSGTNISSVLGSGTVSATAAYQNVTVSTPGFITARNKIANAETNRKRREAKEAAKRAREAQWREYSRLANIAYNVLGQPSDISGYGVVANRSVEFARMAEGLTRDAGIELTGINDIDRARTIIAERHLKIATAAGITTAQADILEDTEIGRKEIEDRTRYHERLAIISSGDSSI